mmetsp:Transcript_7657/g.14608  ORF Transcript_7657/g.14608 Transcript_7657/m.14608 type:complete len:280 (-) Transcript_7657:292-1131(-)
MLLVGSISLMLRIPPRWRGLLRLWVISRPLAMLSAVVLPIPRMSSCRRRRHTGSGRGWRQRCRRSGDAPVVFRRGCTGRGRRERPSIHRSRGGRRISRRQGGRNSGRKRGQRGRCRWQARGGEGGDSRSGRGSHSRCRWVGSRRNGGDSGDGGRGNGRDSRGGISGCGTSRFDDGGGNGSDGADGGDSRVGIDGRCGRSGGSVILRRFADFDDSGGLNDGQHRPHIRSRGSGAIFSGGRRRLPFQLGHEGRIIRIQLLLLLHFALLPSQRLHSQPRLPP